MSRLPTLKEAYDWKINDAGGIFTDLDSVTEGHLPWSDYEAADKELLDLLYYTNRSGSKYCSPLILELIPSSGVLPKYPKPERLIIAQAILAKYGLNWAKLWNTMVAVYDPMYNYDITVERELGRTLEGEESVTDLHTGTDTYQHGKKEATTGTVADSGSRSTEKSESVESTEDTHYGRTESDSHNVFGFNSSTGAPSTTDSKALGGTDSTDGEVTTEGEESVTESNTRTHNLSVQNSGSDVRTKNLTDSRSASKEQADSEEENTHKYGNIGTSTPQRLLAEERKLWVWNYFEQVFDDLDRELVLQVFDACRA